MSPWRYLWFVPMFVWLFVLARVAYHPQDYQNQEVVGLVLAGLVTFWTCTSRLLGKP